jgi:peptide/nickel transport system substrate-binding protein
MNQAVAPFDNVNARRAVIQATDSKALAETLGAGTLKPIDQPFADGTAYHQADPHYPGFDLAAAKKAVDQYTAETGKPLEFSLTIFASNANLALAQILQEQWAKAGIKTQIKSEEQAAAIKEIIVGNTQASVAANFGYPDPDFDYIFWHSSFTGPVGALSINFPHIKNDALDKVLLEGRVNLIPQARQDAYKSAVRLLNDDAVYVWLYRYVPALIADDRVHGLRQAETTGFGTLSAKGWYADLWVARK